VVSGEFLGCASELIFLTIAMSQNLTEFYEGNWYC